MLSIPKNYKSILVTTSRKSITIPMTLYKMENGKINETTALIDSGATICCIDLHFTQRMGWPLEKLKNPITAQHTDGTNNKGGMIRNQINLFLRIDEKDSIQHFFIMLRLARVGSNVDLKASWRGMKRFLRSPTLRAMLLRWFWEF